jgi:uncharacterized protein DUF3854
VIRARGYRSVHGTDGRTHLETLGFSRGQAHNTPGLLMPILDRRGRPVLYQYRPDTPRVDQGKPVKYDTPWKARMRLDFGPAPHDWLGDPAVPLWITEGIKKADALRSHHLHAIGLLGVDNWRGTNARGGKTALPDWEDVALNGRAVHIVFDSDVTVKAPVREALARLTAYLENKDARVTVVTLPAADGEKIGVDDYLLTHPVAELQALANGFATRTRAPAMPPPSPSGRPPLTSARLIAIGREAELFRAPAGRPYARVPLAGRLEVMDFGERGAGVRTWLAGRFHAATGRAASGEALAQAIEVLRSQALFDAPVHEVHVRVASHGPALYLDLANEAREVVELTGDGWRILREAPVYFRRPAAMRPLPHPDPAGTMADLHRLLRLPAGGAAETLVDGWLVHVLMPNGPYSPLCIHGEQGSAKSTLTKMLRHALDPNQAPARRPPKDERDLAVMALHSCIVTLENLSHLPDWLSDALCCLATGSGFSTRKLYADDDEVVFAATRPVMLNGIAEVAVRGDLIDRCTFVTLPPLQDGAVRDEKTLWAAFDAAHPRILGAILNAACTALKNGATTTIADLPRMADYALWVEAAAPAFGWTPGAWLAAYRGNRAAAVAIALEASPVSTALATYLETRGMVDRMPLGQLLSALTAVASADGRRLPQAWPSSPQSLSATLKHLAPALRSQGLELTFHGHTNQGSTISIRRGVSTRSDYSASDAGDESDELLSTFSEGGVEKKQLQLVRGAAAKGQMTGLTNSSSLKGESSSPSSPASAEPLTPPPLRPRGGVLRSARGQSRSRSGRVIPSGDGVLQLFPPSRSKSTRRSRQRGGGRSSTPPEAMMACSRAIVALFLPAALTSDEADRTSP